MTRNKHFRSVFAALLCAVLCMTAFATVAYADGGDYVLLCIDVKKVPAPVKWEAGPHNPSRYYPHIYGACPVSAVTAVLPLRMDSRGQFLKNPELSGYENR